METLTTAQAAFIVGEPLDAFKKSVEKAPVKPRVVRKGGRPVRQFGLADVVFLHAYKELKQEFTPKSQAALYKALHAVLIKRSDTRSEVTFGNHKYDIGRHISVVRSKLKDLEQLAEQIDASGLIKGTGIEAHRIAALLDGGMAAEEILRDYPSLKKKQVLAAKAYAEANPKAGRPYPKLTAKAALRAADLSALDDED
jgi:uncharacterized protein (DUF433 family)